MSSHKAQVVFEEAFLSGMGFHGLLHLLLTTERLRIAIGIPLFPLVDIPPHRIASITMTRRIFSSEMNICYVTHKEHFRTFIVYTNKLKQWEKSFQQVNIRVVIPPE